jgi:hypothetical protein
MKRIPLPVLAVALAALMLCGCATGGSSRLAMQEEQSSQAAARERYTTLRAFALREVPEVWRTIQSLRSALVAQEEQLQSYTRELRRMGRIPEEDAACRRLRAERDRLATQFNQVCAALESLYLKAHGSRSVMGETDLGRMMRDAERDGTQAARMEEQFYEELLYQKMIGQ